MIEEVTKSVRRKKVVDDAFIDALYSDMNALYRLDQTGSAGAAGKAELGPMPQTSVILLCALGGTWILIALYVALNVLRRKK